MRTLLMSVCWLSCVWLYGSAPQDEPPQKWLSHFTTLIWNEMNTLEKKVTHEEGQELASKLPPKATFPEITTLLDAIRKKNS